MSCVAFGSLELRLRCIEGAAAVLLARAYGMNFERTRGGVGCLGTWNEGGWGCEIVCRELEGKVPV